MRTPCTTRLTVPEVLGLSGERPWLIDASKANICGATMNGIRRSTSCASAMDGIRMRSTPGNFLIASGYRQHVRRLAVAPDFQQQVDVIVAGVSVIGQK